MAIMKNTAGKSGGVKKTKDEDAQLSALIDDLVDNHPAETYKFPMMAMCKTVYKGHQTKTIDEEDNSYVKVEDTGETRCKYNIVKPLIDSWASKMLSGDPVPIARPHEGNTESVDVDVAKICSALLASRWSTARMRKKLGGAIKWGGKTGIGIFKQYHNKQGGGKYLVNKDEAKKLGMSESELEELNDLYSGECEIEVVDPEDFFPDPAMQPEWKDHRMVVHRFKKPLTEAEDEFGKPRGTFKADDKSEKEKYRAEATESADLINMSDNVEESAIVYVKELWMKADKKYPNGKHVIKINEEIVVSEDNPTPDKLPFFVFQVNREEDEFYGMGYVYPIHPLQRDFAKAWSLIFDNLEWTAINKILIPTAAGVRANAFNQLAAEKIQFSGDTPPVYLRGEGLPSHLYETPNRVFSVAQIILALPDVDLGNIPERGTGMSGRSIEELKESSAMAHAENKNSIHECVKDLCLDYLETVQEKYSVEKIKEIVGQNRGDDIEKFKEASINEKALDITIALAQGFGMGQAFRTQQIYDAVDRKILSPIEARKGLTNFSNIEMIIDEAELDKHKAERNLRKIVNGEAYANSGLMSAYDNYEVHMQVFKNFTKKPEWDELDRATKMEIDAYIEQAQNMMIQNAQKMAMMAQPPGNPAMAGQQQPSNKTAMQQMQAEDNLHVSPGPPMQQPVGQEPMGTY